MIHALPAARRRRRAVRSSSAPPSPASAATMLIGGMLAVWIRIREQTLDADEHVGAGGHRDPGGAGQHHADRLLALCVFAQWAVYAARRDDRPHVGLALGLVGLIGLAVINAQAYIYNQMELPIAEHRLRRDVLRDHRHDARRC